MLFLHDPRRSNGKGYTVYGVQDAHEFTGRAPVIPRHTRILAGRQQRSALPPNVRKAGASQDPDDEKVLFRLPLFHRPRLTEPVRQHLVDLGSEQNGSAANYLLASYEVSRG